MELGPLDEKYATCGDAHFPATVFGNFSFAVGDLHQQVYHYQVSFINPWKIQVFVSSPSLLLFYLALLI